MKGKSIVFFLAIFCLGLAFHPAWAAPVTDKPVVIAVTSVVDTDPEKLVRAMTTYMKSLPEFYVSGQVLYPEF